MVFNRGGGGEERLTFQQTSTWQSVTFKSQISQMETSGHKQKQMVTTENVRFLLVLDDLNFEQFFFNLAISESFKRRATSLHSVDSPKRMESILL